MSITIAFVCVVAIVLLGGIAFRRWDESRNLRFTDEAGSVVATRALARFEAREVLTHPTWLITLALTVALVSVLVLLDEGGTVSAGETASWFALLGLPIAGLALVVSLHRIGTRALRDGTDELEAATPTAPRARTAGLLLACLSPMPVVIAAAAFGISVSHVAYDHLAGPTPANLVPLFAFILPSVGGAIVGVLLARWLPFVVASLMGLVAIIWLNNGPDHLDPRFRWLRAGVEGSYGGRFDIRRDGLQVAFVVGLITLGACLALWRHPGSGTLVAATIAAVALIVGVGWTMTRNPSQADVAAVVDELENPTAHQRCETRSDVRYCVYPGAETWIDSWAPAVQAVLAQLPPSALPGAVEVVQRPTVDPTEFLVEVEQAIDPSVVWASDGRVHPRMSIADDTPDLDLAWQVAALAVGLPPAVSWDHPAGCMAGGQARLVLAHLLAARATPTTKRAFGRRGADVFDRRLALAPVSMDVEWDYDAEMARDDGSAPVGGGPMAADGVTPRDYLAVVGASGWGSDVLAAKALLVADRSKVDEAISENWTELVDPATSTERFLQLAGVAAGGPARLATSMAGSTACQ